MTELCHDDFDFSGSEDEEVFINNFEEAEDAPQREQKNQPSLCPTPTKGKNVKNGYSAMERFDITSATKLIKYHHLFKAEFIDPQAKKTDLDPFIILKNYVNNSKKGKIKVSYSQRNDRGRYFAEHACSLQAIAGRIRGTIAGDFYYDIDMVNCHPMIFKKLCEDAKLDATYLSSLCHEREKIIKQLMDIVPGVDRYYIKSGLLAIINGGTKFYCDIKDRVLKSGNKWLKNFYVEARRNIIELCKLNSDLYNEMVSREKDRPHSSAVNILFCIEENKLLNIMIDYFRSVGVINDTNNFVNCFDGIMIEKAKCKKEAKLSEHLSKIEALFVEAGYNMKLVSKPFEQINLFVDENDIKDERPKLLNEILSDYATNKFNYDDAYTYIDFYNQFFERSFDSWNDLVNEVGRCASRVIAVVLTGEGIFIKKTRDGIDVTRRLGLSDFKMTYDEGGLTIIKFSDFLKKIPTYGEMVCKLNHEIVPFHSFNIWPGFKAKRVDLTQISDSTREGVELIKNLVRDVWASGNEEHYKYIVSWFAGLVTNLDGINRVAICMISDEGCGKGTLIDFMRYILGDNAVAEIIGIEKLVQKHNTVMQNIRLISVNEMSSTKEEFRSNFDKVKAIITDPFITIEPKGMSPYRIDNMCNCVFSTNHENSLIVGGTDRRYAIFKASNAYINNVPYFTDLRNKCFNQDVADAFYTFMLDFEAVPLHIIPHTEIRQNLQEQSMPSPLKFIKFVKETEMYDKNTWIQSSKLYEKYSNWCTENRERYMSNTNFGVYISSKFEKKKSKGLIMYKMC